MSMKKSDTENRAEKTLHDEIFAIKKLSKLTKKKDFFRAVKFLSNRTGKIIVTGIGKSGFVGMKIAATLTSLGQYAVFIHPVEAFHGDSGAVGRGDVVIAISFSGDSVEINRVVKYFKKEFLVKIIAITGNQSSLLSSISDAVLEIAVKEEGCPLSLAPMASTSTTMIVGDMLASAITSPERFKPKHFATLHPGGVLGLSLKKTREFMTKSSQVPKIKENSTFLEAVREINKKGLGVTAVIDIQRRVVGVITDGDIRRFVLKNKKIDSATARSAMTSQPKCIHEKDSLRVALSTMENAKITSIFVVNTRKELMGIIHIHNIIEQF